MKEMRIIALGQEHYWLQRLRKAAGEILMENEFLCFSKIDDFLTAVRESSPDSLILIDASEQPDIIAMVQRLREQGCKYIVVVTADPTVKEARSIFREAFGYDYWEKTYDTDRIYHQILRCIQEINSNNDSAWKEEPIANTLLDIFSRKERE